MDHPGIVRAGNRGVEGDPVDFMVVMDLLDFVFVGLEFLGVEVMPGAEVLDGDYHGDSEGVPLEGIYVPGFPVQAPPDEEDTSPVPPMGRFFQPYMKGDVVSHCFPARPCFPDGGFSF